MIPVCGREVEGGDQSSPIHLPLVVFSIADQVVRQPQNKNKRGGWGQNENRAEENVLHCEEKVENIGK